MVNYISQDYFERLEQLLISAKEDILAHSANNINILFQLLSSLPLYTDIKDIDIEKYKMNSGNKTYSSFKDRIIANAIKNQKLEVCDLTLISNEIKNYSAFYFLNIDNGPAIVSEQGVALKDRNYDGLDFYNNCTKTDFPLKDDWNDITESVPPCNAMLIVDKYVFGNPFQTKLNNLISFLNLYKANLQVPFHLTIVFACENNRNQICNPNQVLIAFDQLKAMTNLEVQLFSDNNLPTDDRLIFSNYTSGNIGHPFDGRPTRFNQHFLGREIDSNSISRNYRTYKKELKEWYSFISHIPPAMGLIQTRWSSSDFINRLFQAII